jgi:predicted HNH restriction endonuclease
MQTNDVPRRGRQSGAQLVAIDAQARGHVHAYMYYQPKDTRGPFNILFATYDKGEGWGLGGFYENASFDIDGATFPSQVLRRRAQELKVLDAAESLGGKYRDKSIGQIADHLKDEAQYYRWRVLSQDVHRMQEPLRLPKALTSRFGAYFTRPTELEKREWNALIAFAANFTDKRPQDDYSDGGDTEFPEGKQYELKHKARERNPKLVIKAKALFKSKHGRLFCEACKFDFKAKYGNIGDGFIEVHHTIPVSEPKSGQKTSIADLALVCSNCHRILHRRRPWLTISALRKLLRQASP